MRALLCDEPGSLTLVRRPDPEPGPGEVLVRIRRAGVCGTDLHIYQGKHPFLEYPRVMGHELAGEVVRAPAGSHLRSGQTVCVIPYLPCRSCVACRRGKTNCCQHLRVLGVHIDGGFANYVAVPEANLIAVDDLPVDHAAMVEFLAIGAHGMRRAGPAAGDRVLIMGAGPIGIAALAFATLRGCRATVVDLRADRLAFCRERLAAEATLEASPGLGEELRRMTGGELYDLVIEATGHAGSMEQSLAYVAHGGTYLLLGVVLGTIALSDPELHRKEVSVVASRNATPEDFATVLAAIRSGQLPMQALATHRAPLAEVPDRFPTWLRPDAGVVKALIEI